MLIGFGNKKLGKNILTFSLPPVVTCPGSTPYCRKICYAKKGFMLAPTVLKSWTQNFQQSQEPDFVDKVVGDVKNKLTKNPNIKAMRIHVAGDFYSQAYLEKWKQIAKLLPELRFVAWTKSWMLDFSNLPENFVVFYSMMKDTEHVADLSRTAVMVDNLEYAKKINGFLCPYEELKGSACEKCFVCYSANPPQTVVFRKH